MTVAITDEKKPISSAAWPPFMMRPSSSNPLPSVPRRWEPLGAKNASSGFVEIWLVWYKNGPRKQKAMKKTTTPDPTTASLFSTNDSIASRQPARGPCT